MNRIALMEHTCADCATKFDEPHLGDFCYGMLLLWSAPKSCSFLDAIGDVTYREVSDLIKNRKQKIDIEHSDLLQSVYGEVACDTDSLGRPYSIGNPPCPNCGSRRWKSINETIVGWVEILNVSHRLWFSLSEVKKKERVDCAISKFLNQQP
jgi:hypothetical protein